MIDDIYTRLLLSAANSHLASAASKKELKFSDALPHRDIYSSTLRVIYQNDPESPFGLDYGRHLLPNLCDFSRLMLTCSTPLHALYLWQSLHHVQGTCYFPFVYEERDQVVVVLTYPYKNTVQNSQRRFTAETAFYYVLNFISQARGSALLANKILLDFPEPEYAWRYKQELSTQLEYNQPVSAIFLPRSELLKPCQLFNPLLHETILTRFRQAARQNIERQSMQYRVVSQMLHFHPQHFAMPALAANMHISVRGLQKRLSKSEHSFSDLTKNARQALIQYYSLRGLTQEEMAEKLGFKSLAGLRRYLRANTEQPLLPS